MYDDILCVRQRQMRQNFGDSLDESQAASASDEEGSPAEAKASARRANAWLRCGSRRGVKVQLTLR